MTGKICGTGACVPEQIVTNDDLAKIVDTSDEWIMERTGIARRHIAKDETVISMAVEACRKALEDSAVSAEDLDMIVVATLTSNQLMPSASCCIQKALEADSAFCFDMNAACSGFLFALNTAQAYIQSGQIKNALVVGADCMSDLLDWEDRGSCILFGDGAGAVVLNAFNGQQSIFESVMHSDGGRGDALKCVNPKYALRQQGRKDKGCLMTMDGQAVFKFAVKQVPAVIMELLIKAEKSVAEVDYFILHQANKRIIQSVAKRLGVELERFPVNLEMYGNTSSASIPLLLDELSRGGTLKPGDLIVISGFGAGLTWGASLMEW